MFLLKYNNTYNLTFYTYDCINTIDKIYKGKEYIHHGYYKIKYLRLLKNLLQ